MGIFSNLARNFKEGIKGVGEAASNAVNSVKSSVQGPNSIEPKQVVLPKSNYRDNLLVAPIKNVPAPKFTKTNAQLLNEKLRAEARRKEVGLSQTFNGKSYSDAEQIHDIKTKGFRKMTDQEREFSTLESKIDKEKLLRAEQKVGSVNDLLLQTFVGGPTRLALRTGLELTPEVQRARLEGKAEPTIPIPKSVQFITGEEPVTSLGSGPFARIGREYLEKKGVSPDKAAAGGLIPSLAVGLLVESPFFTPGKAATGVSKEFFEKLSKEFGDDVVTQVFKKEGAAGLESLATKAIATSKDSDQIYSLVKPMLSDKADDEVKLISKELVNVDNANEVTNYIAGKKIITESQMSNLGEEGLKDIKQIFKQTKESKVDKAKTFIKELPGKFRKSVVTQYAPMSKFEKDLREASKIKRGTTELPLEQRFELTPGIEGKVEKDIRIFRDEVVAPIANKAEDFNAYLFLKRLQSRFNTGLERMQVKGWNTTKVDATLNALQKKVGPETTALFEKSATRYNEIMDDSLRHLVDKGILTEDAYRAVKETNDFYAKFKVLKYVSEEDVARGSGKNLSVNKDKVVQMITGIKDDAFQLQDLISTGEETILKSRTLAEKNKITSSMRPLFVGDKEGKVVTFLRRSEDVTKRNELVAKLGEKIKETRSRLRELRSEAKANKKFSSKLDALEVELQKQENVLIAELNRYFAEDFDTVEAFEHSMNVGKIPNELRAVADEAAEYKTFDEFAQSPASIKVEKLSSDGTLERSGFGRATPEAEVKAFYEAATGKDFMPSKTSVTEKYSKARARINALEADLKQFEDDAVKQLSDEGRAFRANNPDLSDVDLKKPGSVSEKRVAVVETKIKTLQEVQTKVPALKERILSKINKFLSPKEKELVENIPFPDTYNISTKPKEAERVIREYIKRITDEVPTIQIKETLDLKVERDLVNFFYTTVDKKVSQATSKLDDLKNTQAKKAVEQSDYELLKGIKDRERELNKAREAMEVEEAKALALKSKSVEELKGGVETETIIKESSDDAVRNVERQIEDLKTRKAEIRKELETLRDKTLQDLPDQGRNMDTVSYYHNGIRETVAVPKGVAEAIKGMNGEQVGLLEKVLRGWSTPFRWGTTVANAGFQVANMLADIYRGLIMFKYGNNFNSLIRFPLDVVYSYYSSFKGNFGKMNKLFKAFLESGAANSTIARDLRPQAFKNYTKGIQYLNPKNVLDTVAKFSNALEEGGKLIGLRRGMRELEKGKVSWEQLVDEVRKYSGSPDFSRRGTAMRSANMLLMFLNARVQGTALDLKRLSGLGGGKDAAQAWAKLSAIVGVPAMTLAVYNRENYKEDMDKLSRQEKDNYFIIFKDNFKTNKKGEMYRDYYKIPKREIVKLFSNLIESSVDFAYDRDIDAAKTFGIKFLEDLSPINVSGDNASERIQSVLSGLNPIIKGPIEYGTGKNLYYHQDTEPEYSYGVKTEDVKPEDRYFTSTPGFYKAMGKALGQSPIKLQQLFSTMTGGALQKTPLENIKGRFIGDGKLDLTPEEKKQLTEVVDAVEKQAGDTLKTNIRAQEVYNEIGALSPQERKSRLVAIKETMPKEEWGPFYKRYVNIEQKKQADLGSVEYKLKELDVTNGARAKALFPILKRLPLAERKKQMDVWREQGIVSKNVTAQLKTLFAQEAGKN